MISKKICFIAVLICTALISHYIQAESSLFQNSHTEKIHVNNRVLAAVNGKPISVLDVMKKMDIIFYRHYPEYSAIPAARFQFYDTNWKDVLRELIDKELILVDAEEKKLPLSNGDIRQEMEEIFGPDIIQNLDKAGVTYDEAWNSVKGDILIKRMLYYKVNTKAQGMVTPQLIKLTYDKYAKENVRPAEWSYYMISVRDEDQQKGAEAANFLYEKLKENSTSISELENQLKTWFEGSSSKVTISTKYAHQEKEISEENKAILAELTAGTYSRPIPQKSRASKSIVYRVFFLEAMTPEGAIAFDEMKDKVKDFLMNQIINEETEIYLDKLRHHYGVDKSTAREIPEDFQPFSLS